MDATDGFTYGSTHSFANDLAHGKRGFTNGFAHGSTTGSTGGFAHGFTTGFTDGLKHGFIGSFERDGRSYEQ